MNPLPLICHPSTPCAYVRQVTVCVDSDGEDVLVFRYQIQGDIDQLRLPPQSRSARGEGLWKRTCFEAFIRKPDAAGYFELNFSPSKEWAAYRFADYRQGMVIGASSRAPRIVCKRREDQLDTHVDVHLPSFGGVARGVLQLALSAVLEGRDGRLSYWALAHPPGKPDFHHADGFTLNMPLYAGEG